MKRLVKQSIMNIEMFKGSLSQLSDEGRNILKLIEDYKFKLDQTCRLTANDQQLTQKLQQKRKQLDVASGQIYSIVFDIDNIDITQAYEQQQINTNPNMPAQNPTPSAQPGMQSPNGPQQNPTGQPAAGGEGSEDNDAPVGGGGGAAPSGAAPSSDEEGSDEKGEEKDTDKADTSDDSEDSSSEDSSDDNDSEGNEEE